MADEQDNVIPSLDAHTANPHSTVGGTWVNDSTSGTVDFSGTGITSTGITSTDISTISSGSSGDYLISSGDYLTTTGSGGWATGTIDVTLSGMTGPFNIKFLANGDVKVVLALGEVEREFHVSVAKVMQLLYKNAHLIIEPPPEEDDD